MESFLGPSFYLFNVRSAIVFICDYAFAWTVTVYLLWFRIVYTLFDFDFGYSHIYIHLAYVFVEVYAMPYNDYPKYKYFRTHYFIADTESNEKKKKKFVFVFFFFAIYLFYLCRVETDYYSVYFSHLLFSFIDIKFNS